VIYLSRAVPTVRSHDTPDHQPRSSQRKQL